MLRLPVPAPWLEEVAVTGRVSVAGSDERYRAKESAGASAAIVVRDTDIALTALPPVLELPKAMESPRSPRELAATSGKPRQVVLLKISARCNNVMFDVCTIAPAAYACGLAVPLALTV